MKYMWIQTSRVEAEYMSGCIWMDMDAYFQGRREYMGGCIWMDMDAYFQGRSSMYR
jgi:uncharacterized protein YuzE